MSDKFFTGDEEYVTLSSPEVPEIDPRVREIFDEAMAEAGPPPTVEREVRVLVHAPAHLTLTEIAEMFWDKLDRPDSVLAIDQVVVSTTIPEDKR